MTVQAKLDLEDALAHFGVKGMKWGKRSARPSTSDIKDARVRQNARLRGVQNAEDNLNLRAIQKPSEAKDKAAVRAFQKAEKDFHDNPDRAVAQRLTRGEKAALVVLTGPFAVLPIAGNKAVVKRIEKQQAKTNK